LPFNPLKEIVLKSFLSNASTVKSGAGSPIRIDIVLYLLYVQDFNGNAIVMLKILQILRINKLLKTRTFQLHSYFFEYLFEKRVHQRESLQ